MKGLLESKYPAFQAKTVQNLTLAADLEEIAAVCPELYIPGPGEKEHIIPQFDGYFSLEELPLEELKKRILHKTEYLGGGNGLATTTQILKQADVVLAMMLFDSHFTDPVKKANWEYYEPRTEHGSSLSACAYAVTAARNGNTGFSYEYFMKTATIDLTGKSKQYVGDLYIGGTHPAANGGAWLAAVQGLAGIKCEKNILMINPHLPEHWKKLTIPLKVGPKSLKIEITHAAITVHCSGTEYYPLTISSGSRSYNLEHKELITIQREETSRDKVEQVLPTKAAIFDLDGVIVDTARYHYLAWKKLAEELGIDFDEKHNQLLKGVDRMGSLEILLNLGGMQLDPARKTQLAEQKNQWYVEYISRMDSSEVLPGAYDYLRSLKQKNIKTALGSASKNAGFILEKLELTGLFDAVIDGTQVERSKPDPEVFLLAARALGEKPEDCVVFEDALSGVQAARRAGMKVIGIGEAEILTEADTVISGLYELTGNNK